MIKNKRCTVGCPKTGRLEPPKFVEVKLHPGGGTCVGRNGVFSVGTVCFEDMRDGSASIGFVSSKLKRRIHAGGMIPATAMDQLAREWLRMRKLEPGATLPEKGEIRDYVKHLESIVKGMKEMLEAIP